ncbi:hypothetical protein [Pyrofollis japonicus]|uniref:hypothetical protein n=1 Tax=Pyrofollis japonicus TaxID=3060460 RepID=UPI00295BFE0D|nr:hypothetical protein [Pyrofollis japonicus]
MITILKALGLSLERGGEKREAESGLAWRNMMTNIIASSIETVKKSCLEGELEAEECAKALIAAADAVYSPLKPVDSGLGEARRIAGILSSILANAFIVMFVNERGEEPLKDVLNALKELREGDVSDKVKEILEAAQVVVEPATAPEPREAMYKDIEEYVNPPQPQIPRRRRQQVRKPDPNQRLRRLIRELGRRDPILAKAVARLLRERGISA